MNVIEILWHFAKYCNQQFTTITERLDKIMAAVQVEQTDLDTLAAQLESLKDSLATELADLEAKVAAGQPLPAGSLDGLRQAVTDLQSLQPPAATETAPVDQPPTQ